MAICLITSILKPPPPLTTTTTMTTVAELASIIIGVERLTDSLPCAPRHGTARHGSLSLIAATDADGGDSTVRRTCATFTSLLPAEQRERFISCDVLAVGKSSPI